MMGTNSIKPSAVCVVMRTEGFAGQAAGAGVLLALGAHALALQLALPLQIRLVDLVRVWVQRAYDAQHLRREGGPSYISVV